MGCRDQETWTRGLRWWLIVVLFSPLWVPLAVVVRLSEWLDTLGEP